MIIVITIKWSPTPPFSYSLDQGLIYNVSHLSPNAASIITCNTKVLELEWLVMRQLWWLDNISKEDENWWESCCWPTSIFPPWQIPTMVGFCPWCCRKSESGRPVASKLRPQQVHKTKVWTVISQRFQGQPRSWPGVNSLSSRSSQSEVMPIFFFTK